MKITRRQEAFIQKLLDLYREVHEPIHYSTLAERLGVSPFTAYDMLRLLEEKGFVTSDYLLAADKSGPGRSEVVFAPTPLADQFMAQLAVGTGSLDLEAARERILQSIQSGDLPNIDVLELAQEVLTRVPYEGDEATRYCLEVVTFILVRVQRKKSFKIMREYAQHIGPTAEEITPASLIMLLGVALGLWAAETDQEPTWGIEITEHIRRYQALVMAMDAEQCHRLGETLMTLAHSILEGEAHQE